MKKIIHRPCEICGNIMDLKVNNQKNSKNYGKIITPHRNKRFCSKKCQIEWQQIVKWEDRIGEDNAKRMRKNASDRVKGDKNPSKNKEVAKKISNSIKKYLKDNPRNGDKNPFYGKSHTDE